MSKNTLTVVEPHFEFLTTPETMKDLIPLIELAGRTCYKSEDKVHDDSAERFIANIMKRGHLSVIEHGSVTVKYVCSRACSHQLVRHRIAAYSQESQRYCDYSSDKRGDGGLHIIVPPSIGGITIPEGVWYKNPDGVWDKRGGMFSSGAPKRFFDSVLRAYQDYIALREEGIPAEDARFLLPNACKTEVTTTFNLRQWYHVFEHRALNPKAQWELRGITLGILGEFARHLPCIFGNLNALVNEEHKR